MKGDTVVEVEWDDHCFMFGTGDPKVMRIHTIGYYVSLTPDGIVVALNKNDEGEFAEKQFIDMRMLIKWRYLHPEKTVWHVIS